MYQKWIPCFKLTQYCVTQHINLSNDSSALGCSKEGKGAKSQEECQMLLTFSLLLAIIWIFLEVFLIYNKLWKSQQNLDQPVLETGQWKELL